MAGLPFDDGDPYWNAPAPAKNHGEGGGLFRTLSLQDIRLLRKVIKKVHREYFGEVELSDYECDKMIDSIGQETAEKLIARGVKNGGRV